MKTTLCDRCGQRDDRCRSITILDITQDLCVKCVDLLEGFAKGEQVPSGDVPKGYKKVARPCPHHIPCAEPWGCSGQEIVPLDDPREAWNGF